MSISNLWRRLKYALMTLFYTLAVTLGVFSPSIASADALIAYGGSSVTGAVEEIISLPGITVSGSDPSIPMSVSIDDGILYMEDTTGLTFSSDTRATTLSFSGNVTDINNALATLKYRSIQAGAKTLTATILGDGVVFFPENGHLYEVVNNDAPLSWDEAVILAAGRTLNGATGYLATVTTQAENDYLVERLTGDGWFGASDVTTEGDWKWVTGPETGTSFWTGNENGSPVESRFANWAGSEPNDYEPGEDCAQFYSDGSGWNDLPCDGPYLSYYVVEYGAPSDVPTAPEDVTFTVNVTAPSADIVSLASCLDLLDFAEASQSESRYDTVQLTTNIDCTGESIQPLFEEEDPDFGFIGYRGEFDGNGFSLENFEISSFSETVGLFATTNGASFHDITLSGTVSGNYCVGGLVGNATNTSFTDITSTIDVEGAGEVGGLVGCYEANESAEEAFSDISVTNTVINYDDDRVGGVVGKFDSYGSSYTTFERILNDTEFIASSGRLGGVIGEVDSSNDSILSIHDITVESIDVETSTIGGVIGEVDTEDNARLLIDEITIAGSITGGSEVGAIIGELDNDASTANASISDTHIEADVTGQSSVGGLVGEGYNMEITNSSYQGAISSPFDYVGGLVGQADNIELSESWTAGTIQSTDGGYNYGGLFGESYESNIEESYSTMDTTGPSGTAGGLVGAQYYGTISNSYARGDIVAGTSVGGLVGYCEEGSINDSYATGLLATDSDAGGLLGTGNDCITTNSFWDTETSSFEESFGDETGKLTAEMKDLETFTNTDTAGLEESWNFDDVWSITTAVNDGYPCLQWQDENCVNSESDTTPADEDGVATETENAAPNSGDADNDGTQDSEQNNVSSFVNPITSQYSVIKVDAACTLSAVSAEQESAQTVADSGYNYSSGLVKFTASCGTPGYSTTANVIVYGTSASELILRKYNPNTKAYFTINNATIVDTTIGGKKAAVATYQIIDGGVLDTDGSINGIIVDPVGLASLVVGVPNTGFQR